MQSSIILPTKMEEEEEATEYQFFDMVKTRTENTEPSTLRWSKDTVARVVGRMTDTTSGSVKYMIEWQQSPYHGFSSAFVLSKDIQPHTDMAHSKALPPGEAAKNCIVSFES